LEKPVTQKIVGNFVVGTVYSSNEIGQWTGTYVVRRYGVNNGRVIALKEVPGQFGSCEEAAKRAMEQGEQFAKTLDPDSGDIDVPGSGDELFIPPSAGATTQRNQSASA
jgi:ABC-type sugar transport system substrate-binding protein